MRRRTMLGSSLALMAAGCGVRSYSFNYRFKIVVRVGDDLREGSSVIKVRFSDQRGGCCGSSFPVSARGEAPVVDLGEGRYLFALLARVAGDARAPDLLGDRYFGDMPLRVLGRRFPEAQHAALQDPGEFPAYFEQTQTVLEEVDLLEEEFPTFVTFANPQAPASVEIVTPEDIVARFGVTTIRCSVRLTREPVTRELMSLLPWLVDWPRRGIQNGLVPSSTGPERMLTDEFFVRR